MSEDFPGSGVPFPEAGMTHCEAQHWLLTSQQHKAMQVLLTPALSLMHDL